LSFGLEGGGPAPEALLGGAVRAKERGVRGPGLADRGLLPEVVGVLVAGWGARVVLDSSGLRRFGWFG
jgi:hypothetical protein